jgi:hypothetical protein
MTAAATAAAAAAMEATATAAMEATATAAAAMETPPATGRMGSIDRERSGDNPDERQHG